MKRLNTPSLHEQYIQFTDTLIIKLVGVTGIVSTDKSHVLKFYFDKSPNSKMYMLHARLEVVKSHYFRSLLNSPKALRKCLYKRKQNDFCTFSIIYLTLYMGVIKLLSCSTSIMLLLGFISLCTGITTSLNVSMVA